MSNSSIVLQEKYLPMVFSYGYLSAFQVVMGRSNVESYYQSASDLLDPTSDRNMYKSWLEPLYSYFGRGLDAPQPLDYFFLRLIQAGLIRAMPSKDQLLQKITRKIGKVWWYGDAPISTYQDKQSLNYLLSQIIREKLDNFKFGSIHTEHSLVKSSDQLINLGIRFFIEELSARSNINCNLDIKYDSQITFIVSDCPFCTQQSISCHVFLGVIESFLEWAHGMHQPNPISTRIIINEVTSTGHYIILDSPQ